RAAVFVTPSREEGWGIAISEALQAGAKVVCYDLPVYREVHEGAHLYVVPIGDPKRFADQVVDIVQRAASPEKNATPMPNADSKRRRSKTWSEIASYELAVVNGDLDLNRD